jgi:hypothetical protein
MNKTTKIAFGVALAALLMVCTIPASATTFDGNETDLYCYQASVTPTIDGNISAGEWSDADNIHWYYTPISDHYNATIYCYAKWDADYIYFMVDLCPDNSSEELDFCEIWLDEDHDGDFSYGSTWEHFIDVEGDGDVTLMSWNYWELGMGSGFEHENLTSASAYMGFDTSSRVVWEHRIIEFRLDLDLINITGTVGVMFDGYGTLSPNYFSTEGATSMNFDDNETVANWTDLHLLDTHYLTGTITDTLIPMVISLMGVIITVVVISTMVRVLGKSFKGMK